MKKTTRIPFSTESVDEDSKTIEFVMSTNDTDRHGDNVVQNWLLENFKENPVFINSHNYDDAAEAIGKVVELTETNDSLEGRVKFAVDENPKARVIYDLYKGGFLNAVSVGFRELADKAGNTVNELLELSAVTVPANAMATAKAKGIDTEPLEEEVDEQTREEMEELIEDAEEQEKTVKEGRVLSAANRNKVENAIEALTKLLEADNKNIEKAIKEDEEEEEQDNETEDKEKSIRDAIKSLHQEISETHEGNLDIKKRKIHKALRNIEA